MASPVPVVIAIRPAIMLMRVTLSSATIVKSLVISHPIVPMMFCVIFVSSLTIVLSLVLSPGPVKSTIVTIRKIRPKIHLRSHQMFPPKKKKFPAKMFLTNNSLIPTRPFHLASNPWINLHLKNICQLARILHLQQL